MALSTANGHIFAGDVYLRPIIGTAFGKMVDVGNTTKLEIGASATIKEQISKKRNSYGTTLEAVGLPQPAELGMTIETVNRANLRYAFMGLDAAYAQTADVVVDEAVLAELGGWVSLASEDLDDAVVVTNSAGTTTYAEGVDYELNRRLGWIMALPGGAITEAQPLKVDYEKKEFTGARIRGNVAPQIRAQLILDGMSLVDNSIGILRCWSVMLTPTGKFDFFSDDWNTIELNGRLIKPADKAEPFVFDQR